MADNFVTVAPESTAPVALPIATKQLDDASHAGVTVIVDKAGARARFLEITAANAAKVDGSAVTQPVSGPLTDAQLRASAVPISMAAGLAASANNIGDVDVLTLPALPAGTNEIGKVGLVPQTSGGLSTFHLVSAASTNATNVKASAGQLFGYYIYNSNAAARKVVIHNTAGTPTAGAGVILAIVIPGSSAANVEFTNGIAFATGIAITTVTGLADSDTTAVALNDLNINLMFK